MTKLSRKFQADIDAFRRILANLACFDEEHCVGMAASAPSLCKSEYMRVSLLSAAEIARQHGLLEVAGWLLQRVDGHSSAEPSVDLPAASAYSKDERQSNSPA